MGKYLSVILVLASLGWTEGQWVVQPNPADTTDYAFSDVCFIDSLHGWVVQPNGSLLRTEDGGKTWKFAEGWHPQGEPPAVTECFQKNTRNSPFGGGVTAIDSLHCWIAALWQVWFSEDGGRNWVERSPGGYHHGFNDIRFVDLNHGWIVGYSDSTHRGEIYYTNDNGKSWQFQDSKSSPALNAVCFRGTLKGFVVGTAGLILKTEDGGQSWQKQEIGTTQDLRDLVFCDSLHGLMVGGGGTVLRTTDGGKTWKAETTEYVSGPFWDVAMPDRFHNWAVSHGKAILYTADGGIHWSRQTSPIDQTIYGVSFPDTAHGWAVGEYGKIIHYATSQGISETDVGREKTAYMLQIYPNPTKRVMKIKYQVSSGMQFMELRVYDTIGQLIRILASESKPPGLYTIDWDGRDNSSIEVPPGVYYIRLKTDKGSAVEKIVLLK